MTIEKTMNRMVVLEIRIKEGTASKLEALELANNGNSVKNAAIQLLKNWATSDYGDGYFDGFVEAQNLYQKDVDLNDYSKQNIMELSEAAELDFDARNSEKGENNED